MTDHYTKSEIDLILDSVRVSNATLRGAMEQGFKGVHDRLDTLNHSTASHERRLNERDKWQVAMDIRTKSIDGWWVRILNWFVPAVCSGAMVLIVLVLTQAGIVNLHPAPTTKAEASDRLIDLQAQAQKLSVDIQNVSTTTNKVK